jgi:hypothetical protein
MHTVPLPRHRACRIYVGYFHPLRVRRCLVRDCSENTLSERGEFQRGLRPQPRIRGTKDLGHSCPRQRERKCRGDSSVSRQRRVSELRDRSHSKFLAHTVSALWPWSVLCLGQECPRSSCAATPSERHRGGEPVSITAGTAVPPCLLTRRDALGGWHGRLACVFSAQSFMRLRVTHRG